MSSVALACLVYAGSIQLIEEIFSVSSSHEAGYICSMLFIIPGFPFITSGIDFAKQDMRSGLERLIYAVMIIVVATVTAWAMALLLNLQPEEFPSLALSPVLLFLDVYKRQRHLSCSSPPCHCVHWWLSELFHPSSKCLFNLSGRFCLCRRPHSISDSGAQ